MYVHIYTEYTYVCAVYMYNLCNTYDEYSATVVLAVAHTHKRVYGTHHASTMKR